MIRLEQVYKSFGGQEVLSNISLDIPDGSRLCLIGGSGSGKSVLLKLILGLEFPDKGDIKIGRHNTRNLSQKGWQEVLDDFGVVFQGSALFDSLRIWENVGIKLIESRQFEREEILSRVAEALTRVNLETDILQKYPAELSGGMRKRVAIARAIIHEPRYLMYDEPTTGLDPVSAELIESLIESLAKESDRTSVIVTHDMRTVRRLATHIAMIYQHHLLYQGVSEGFFQSSHPYIRDFLSRDIPLSP